MSKYTERATMSLHKMVHEMHRKGIELPRITKCATQLLMIGITPNSIPKAVVEECICFQHSDGGWVSVVDTMWNAKFLSFFPNTDLMIERAIKYLQSNRVELGYGRSARDMGRIPVTGMAFYLLPQLADQESLAWLENLWKSELNSLTYKAAYTLMAFNKNDYMPQDDKLIKQTIHWLISQQEDDGGYAPWKNHPVKSNVYCTAVATIGLLKYIDQYPEAKPTIDRAYDYICRTQLINGIWPYHELEDGGAWGLAALSAVEFWRETNENQ